MADMLDLGPLTSPEGYYLLAEGPSVAFTGEAHPDSAYQHKFTYRGSDGSLKRAAIDLINAAQRKVFLASFRIGDRDLLNALFAAVDRLSGGVYIITSWTETSLRRDLASLEDMDGVDVQAQKKRFDELTHRGIALRGHEHCHAKFLVVDDNAALVSSANLETSALADQPRRKATGENGVIVTDTAEVGRLARFFTRLWYSGCTWEALPGGEYALHHRDPVPSPATAARLTDGPGVIWTDGEHGERGILAALHDVIGRARHELLLATFSLVGVRDQPQLLLDPLRRAMANYDLDVRLLVRARNNIAAHRADTAALADLGVTVHADSYTHAKGVIADGRYGALFSANFDAEHGMFDGVEVGVRLDERPVLAEAKRFFEHAMAHADMRFASHPTQHELDRGLGARWRRRWPHSQRMPIVANDREWRSLETAATTGPVLWEEMSSLRIYVSDIVATLVPMSSTGYRLSVDESTINAATRLQNWCQEPQNDRKMRRGCCPAALARA